MTREQIIEIFIRAAEVDRKLPDTARPKALKAMSIGYVHTTAEMNQWHAEDKHAANWAWLDPAKLKNSTNDMGLWELSMELMKLVKVENQRRALWAWSVSKAGGMSLAKWSKTVEHVGPATAQHRAMAAITRIHQYLCSNVDLHNGNDMNEDLRQEPEMPHKSITVGAWRDEDAKPLACYFDTDIAGMEYAEIQNAKRRERDARRRQAA